MGRGDSLLRDQHPPTAAFQVARWLLRRMRRGYGGPFGRIPHRFWGGDALTIDTEVGPMLVPVSDLSLRRVLIFGRLLHEESEVRLCRKLLARSRRVLDVGANLGWYSVLASRANPDAEIHAFEANPDILPYLEANASGRRIQVHPVAVSDHSGALEFFCTPDSSGYSSATRRVGRPVTVSAVTLDELSLGPVDFVKVDVEGGELAVLRGARRLRAESPHAVWMIEADGDMLREAGSSLEALDDELALGESTHLYAVEPGGSWRPIRAFSDMRGALHKNVLVVPRLEARVGVA